MYGASPEGKFQYSILLLKIDDLVFKYDACPRIVVTAGRKLTESHMTSMLGRGSIVFTIWSTQLVGICVTRVDEEEYE